MSKNITENLLPFKYEDAMNLNELLKHTKHLVKDNLKYNNYINKYNEKINVMSFKLPDVTVLPIGKGKEETKSNKYEFKTMDMLPNQSFVMSMYRQNEMNSTISTRAHYSKNHSKNNSMTNFDLIKKRISNETNVKRLQPKQALTFYKFIDQKDKITNLNNYWDLSKSLNEIDLFVEEPNKNLVYDNKMIFNNLESHKTTIENAIENFKLHKNENLTTTLKKCINANSQKEIQLSFNSMKFSFRNLTDKSKVPIEFDLPFALTPIFYSGDLEAMKAIIISVFKFNEEFDELTWDESDCLKMLFTMEIFNSEFIGDEKVRLYFFKKNKDNIYFFYWLTPVYIYEVEVRLPEIEIYLPKQKLLVRKFIDSELLFYIYEKKFAFWDFYVSNYLISFKDFRKLISKAFSKSSETGNGQFIHHEKIFTNENRVNRLSESDNKTSYLISHKEDNGTLKHYLHVLKSFSVKTKDENLSTRRFEFNFKQLKIISKLSEVTDLTTLFKKLLHKRSINGVQSISMNLDFFKDYDESFFERSKDINQPEKKIYNVGNRIDTVWPYIDIYSVENGRMQIETVEAEIHLNKNTLRDFSSNSIEEWIKIINESKPWNYGGRKMVEVTKKDSRLSVLRRKSIIKSDCGRGSSYKKSESEPLSPEKFKGMTREEKAIVGLLDPSMFLNKK